jgi:hypothetical protein
MASQHCPHATAKIVARLFFSVRVRFTKSFTSSANIISVNLSASVAMLSGCSTSGAFMVAAKSGAKSAV